MLILVVIHIQYIVCPSHTIPLTLSQTTHNSHHKQSGMHGMEAAVAHALTMRLANLIITALGNDATTFLSLI